MNCPTCGQAIPKDKPLDMKVVKRKMVDALWKTGDRTKLLVIAEYLGTNLDL